MLKKILMPLMTILIKQAPSKHKQAFTSTETKIRAVIECQVPGIFPGFSKPDLQQLESLTSDPSVLLHNLLTVGDKIKHILVVYFGRGDRQVPVSIMRAICEHNVTLKPSHDTIQ